MDCRSASDADRVCDCGDGVQCPKERKPMCFMDLDPRTEILANSIDVRECFYLNATADSTTPLPYALGSQIWCYCSVAPIFKPRPSANCPTAPSTWNSIPVIFANRSMLVVPTAHPPSPVSVAIR